MPSARSFLCRTMLLLTLLTVATGSACAQDKRITHQIGFDLRPAYVVPTHSFFDGNNRTGEPVHQMNSVHLKYAFRFNPNTRWGSLYPHAYQGIGISYNRFDNPGAMGSPVGVYVFQGSRIARLTDALSLDYEWNFGASFGWKKGRVEEEIDAGNRENIYYNEITGSAINAYINASFLLNWQLSPHWNLAAGIDLTHYSNGNTHYPNAGINLIGGRIGLVHTFGRDTEESTAASSSLAPKYSSHFCYDVVLYGATRKQGFTQDNGHAQLLPGVFGVAGFNFTPLYSFNKYFRAGISLDAQYDESSNLKEYYVGEENNGHPHFYRPPFYKQFGIGLSARAELSMPIFSIGIGIGHNVIYHGADNGDFYQILALKTFLTRSLFLHVGYQLNKFQYPNNLMLGVGWRFHGKK